MQSSAEDFTSPPIHKDPFDDLPETLRRAIWEKGTLKDYGPGTSIAAPGDPGNCIRFMISGSADVLLQELEGQAIPVETIHAGDLVGEISFLTGRPSPLNSEVVAQEPSRVLEIHARDFEKILRENPDCAVSVLRNLARKVIRLDQSVFRNMKRKRALQALISSQDHLFPDYFVSDTVRRRTGKRLENLATSQGPILITGETGVGKEFMAHAIYGMSPHHKRVFLCLDLLRPLPQTPVSKDYCELPEWSDNATEEQMKLFFGYEKVHERNSRIETPGYLELTEEGTLLVRGIEQLTPVMQERLLKTLQTGSFRRMGSDIDQHSDFRLIGTTNLDSSEISAEKHPLLHWLLDHSLMVPPLRKRRKEIPALVEHYVNQYGQELHKSIRKIPTETIKTLVTYSWPGNDRELATTLKRAVLLAEDEILRPQDIYFDLRRIEADGKFNLLRLPGLKAAFKSPLFPAIFQSMAAPFFFILLILLFLGPADPINNMGGLFSWAVGWPTMVFGAFFWARFWCSVCPMGSLSKLAKKIISLEIPFPSFLKLHSDWIIAGSAIFIIWLETATNIRSSPLNTGILLLTIFLLAVVFSVIFERQSWCRYLCPLGGMMGVFAKVSPFELRADRNVCASQCTTNECFVGTGDREGCPFGQMAPTLRSNRFCKMCATCIKNCPHGAINLNLRVPGREIWEIKQVGSITAFLVISMFAGLACDMQQNMTLYDRWSDLFSQSPQILVFSLFFLASIAAANLLVVVASGISCRSSGETLQENFARYGLALLPLVLTGYMAFHLYYLINLGVYLPILLWQTFHFEFLGQLVITVPPSWTLFFQQFLVCLGLLGSLVLSYRLSRAKQTDISKSLVEFLPHVLTASCFAFVLLNSIRYFFY
jgi:transcriptional regulator with AAA-type ATPase domain/ferredoxin